MINGLFGALDRNSWNTSLLIIFLLVFFNVTKAEGQNQPPFLLQRDCLQFDKGDIQWAEGAKEKWDKEKQPANGPYPFSGWTEYSFEVPRTGWYTLHFKEWNNFAHSLYLDGKRLYYGGIAGWPGQPQPKTTDGVKAANLPLSAGKHVLRFERLGRVGFPAGFPRSMELRESQGKPSETISAKIAGQAVLRSGEKFVLEITAGGSSSPAEYEIIMRNGLTGAEKVLEKISFPAGSARETRRLEIPCSEEGVFSLQCRIGKDILQPCEFQASYVVIDTKTQPAVAKDSEKTLVHEIDCISNTVDGKPVIEGTNYWECNGKTRINESAAGKYRETNDGRGEGVEVDKQVPASNFSGFAYLLDIEPGDQPYMLEIEHPDDDWRSVCVSLADVDSMKDQKGFMPPQSGYETGGIFPLSMKMLTHRMIFWSNSKQLHVGIVSARIGRRAGASKIRIYRVGTLPSLAENHIGNRIFASWMEEKDRWHIHFNTPKQFSEIERDYIGIKRWVELLNYTGMNGLWPTEAAYQQCTYDSQKLKGYLPKSHDAVRISALMCEKYRMGYIPEIFLGKQGYFNSKVIPSTDENPSDLYDFTYQGISLSNPDLVGGVLWPSWNIMHPKVQQVMLDIYGELAAKVADSPAFAGMSGRLGGWLWDGLYSVSSLQWGYGDWNIAQFEKDTGVKTPGKAGDPARFEQRFDFLTSGDMRAKWIQWRAGRVTEFLRKLRDSARGGRSDVTLFLCGDGRTDEVHGSVVVPGDMRQRFLEMGIDLERLSKEEGIAIVPGGGYGRGKSATYLAEQKAYDAFLDPKVKAIGYGKDRSFYFYGQYTEWGSEFPLKKLGDPLKNYWYTGASDAVGDKSLERLAVVLADEDTMFVREGGYGYTYGDRDIRGKWLQEFTALPRTPFVPLAEARDPVAVWYSKKSDQLPVASNQQNPNTNNQSLITDNFFFYAVNRERYPVRITLELASAKDVVSISTGKAETLAGGKLVLDLQPFELRSFKAAPGASITSALTEVPDTAVVDVKKHLAFCQDLADEISAGAYKTAFSKSQKDAFLSNLSTAWDAYQKKHYWRARTAMSMAPMMLVFKETGIYPKDQVITRFPDLLEYESTDRFDPPESFMDAAALEKCLVPGGKSKLVSSETYNKEWRLSQVIRSDDGSLDFDVDVPAAGSYSLYIGHVAEAPGVMMVAMGGKSLPVPAVTREGNNPERTAFPPVRLSPGKNRLSIRRADSFGVYGIKLVPQLRAIPATSWSTIGPFPSKWNTNLLPKNYGPALKATLSERLPVEEKIDFSASYTGRTGKPVKWEQSSKVVGAHAGEGVNFSFRSGSLGYDICYAVTFITSPEERSVVLMMGSDWWGNAYLNGEIVKTEMDAKVVEEFGSYLHRWKPIPATVKLKKGENVLLVKNQGGSAWNWFTCFISDTGDLEIKALPEKR
ncbi:MAG: hypothetical protein WAX69_02020 [Victivallales bacterium]